MKKDSVYIKHILDSIQNIEEYTAGMNREDFFSENSKMVRSAVVREFEIIGEATGRLSDKLKRDNSEIPWRDIQDMRNKLIHEYFGVDIGIIWKTVESDLPVLKSILLEIASPL
jgi:uncharacterized protein with HEPN domain